MQADAFPRISGARNPIVIVKIFIFLPLKVVLQAKLCKGGWCIFFFELLFGILSDLRDLLGTYTLQLDF